MVRPEEYKSGHYIILQADPQGLYEVLETQEKNIKIKSVATGAETWYDASGEQLRPAVLSDDWLISFGFTQDVLMERDVELARNFTLITERKTIRLRSLKPYYELVEPYLGKIPLPKIKYVHLLQDFYEEQTGKKLQRNK